MLAQLMLREIEGTRKTKEKRTACECEERERHKERKKRRLAFSKRCLARSGQVRSTVAKAGLSQYVHMNIKIYSEWEMGATPNDVFSMCHCFVAKL